VKTGREEGNPATVRLLREGEIGDKKQTWGGLLKKEKKKGTRSTLKWAMNCNAKCPRGSPHVSPSVIIRAVLHKSNRAMFHPFKGQS